MNLLIVDDIDVNRKLLRAILEAEGHVVSEGADGVTALAMLESGNFDAIISDILMPKMDGYRLCSAVRTSRRFHSLPFIFYTSSYTSASDEKLARELGADRFVRKPATAQDLLLALTEAVTADRQQHPSVKITDTEVLREYSERLIEKLEQRNAELAEANQHLVLEIRERQRAEAALQRQRDLFDMLAQTNQAIVRCTGRDELFAAVCRVAVEHGHFLFAWIGLVDAHDDQVLRVASYGESDGYFDNVRISADENAPTGRGPIGRAIRTGHHAVSNDFLNDSSTTPEHDAARQARIRASASLPIHDRGVVIAALILAADTEDFFTDAVVATLDEMAKDVSFALDNFSYEAERVQAAQALQESEAKFRQMSESLPQLIWTCRADGYCDYLSPQWVDYTGVPEPEQLGLGWLQRIHAEDRKRTLSIWKAMAPSATSIDVEIRIRRKDGLYRWFRTRAVALRDDQGRVLKWFGTNTDIEDQRQMEAQLRLAQKMEALGTLAGGIAHDFNNILGTILGNTELARQDVGSGHPAIESLDEIRKASNRAKDLVQRILAFGRQQQQPQGIMPLQPIVEEAVALLRATLPAGVELTTAFDTETPTVRADPTQVHQVLMNLCTNAWHALGEKNGRIDVCLDAITLDAEAARADANLSPGHFARLRVTDNGSGMDAAILERVFDPFFTTKPVGQGTGLGLSVVHGIAETHGGAVTVKSQPGRGTTFSLYFPAAEAPQPGVGPANAAGESRSNGGGQHVLYLDDEESLVFLASRLLRRLGYRVSGFTRPEEALAAVRADPGQFDLVVTDQNMPRISGLEVAREVKRLRSDLPVVLASGYITEDLRAAASRAGVRQLVNKPSTVDELAAAVHRLAGPSRTTVAAIPREKHGHDSLGR